MQRLLLPMLGLLACSLVLPDDAWAFASRKAGAQVVLSAQQAWDIPAPTADRWALPPHLLLLGEIDEQAEGHASGCSLVFASRSTLQQRAPLLVDPQPHPAGLPVLPRYHLYCVLLI